MAFTLQGDEASRITIPTPLPNPYWVVVSRSAAELIDLELNPHGLPVDSDWLDILAGNSLNTPSVSFERPLATAYSGHQFGVWAGQLGDGRAILLGDMAGFELQLKGAGKTPYSRMGDGRAVLRSSIREFLCSEAMHALGIPTTRALSVVGSPEMIRRESMETAAVCARLAPSFLRIGHFEHFASTGNVRLLKQLADTLILDHYPECAASTDPYIKLFTQICARNAILVAQWQAVGFCHGVLNSDNISVLGLTLDYGPFGFMDYCQLDHVCNHSDRGGRYAYHRQPQVMHWNMACLASAFLPLLELHHSAEESQDLLRNALHQFTDQYAAAWKCAFQKKLGLNLDLSSDVALIERLLQGLHHSGIDFSNFFRSLGAIKVGAQDTQTLDECTLGTSPELNKWISDYRIRLSKEIQSDEARSAQMAQSNPKFILRNHLAQHAIEMAQAGDFSEVERLLGILSTPYDEQASFEAYSKPPPKDSVSIPISCSS